MLVIALVRLRPSIARPVVLLQGTRASSVEEARGRRTMREASASQRPSRRAVVPRALMDE
ncbi:hypothetical protein BE20_01845 [Sorangium cellulosum]|uniref:Uncharacterized protein n=1 Tax=Sorangium cellulosum TaxID=56 RepID=A0A150SBP2_SORCE|nr:hypothetical protein BE18_01980 [Sorangium cellulosum]KYF91916.1 hypothetical protein BE20_01845 [Sorangium cellulosum]